MQLPDSIQLTEKLEKELFPDLPDIKLFAGLEKFLKLRRH